MLLWGGQVVSVLGSSIAGLVMPLLILSLTGSPAAAGLAGMFATIPYVLLSLPAGAMVDRWNRKRVMVLCDLGRAVAFASIPVALFFNALTIWQIYAVALVEGTLFVFFNIAEVAALPRVVPKAQLGDATAQNMATFGAAGLVGPGLGGFLYKSVGQMVPFVVDAVSYLVSAISLLLIKTRFQEERTRTPRNLRAEIREGLAWMWNERLVRLTSFLSGGMNLVGAGSFLIVILLAKEMGADEAATGVIFSVAAVGGIVGAALGGRIHRRFAIGHIITATTWSMVLAFPLYAFAPNVWVLGLISAVTFFTVPVYSVAVLSYRLALIPDALQGRVNSAVRLVAFGFQPLGSTLAGFLLENIGSVPTVWVFSAIMLLLGLLVVSNPTLRGARVDVEKSGQQEAVPST
jgi:MFS family permease